MAGVTDSVFRFMLAKYSKYGGEDLGEYGKEIPETVKTGKVGALDVIYTEFISANGLFLGGKESLVEDMSYTDLERPIVAQFFSSNAERMKRSARLAVEMGFDGIDINLGCPDRSVCKQGAGSELIKSPKVACEVIEAVKEGAGDTPVSVKTRAGYLSDSELDDWLGVLLKTEPACLALHARTRKDMYKGPARWELVERAVRLRNSYGSNTLILGNGDITSLDDLYQKVNSSGADGGMVGRAVIGNPWFFSRERDIHSVPVRERLEVLVEHCELFEKVFRDRKSFAFMKKHFSGYVSGWEGAKELRTQLMEAKSASDVEETVKVYLKRSCL